MYNTRIAPSPTGSFHLGTARTAYFNWLAARATGGKFILRIDDTDPVRSDPKYNQIIFDTMDWLGLNYDSVVYQSSRFSFYKSQADILVFKGLAKILDDGAIILYPTDMADLPDHFTDTIAGDIPITKHNWDEMHAGIVLIRSDGTPTYHWSCVVDDIDLGINYVIRGHDHITNTSRQIVLYKAINFPTPIPKFAHVGLIHADGKKLSKRDDAGTILWYRDQGYDPDAMLSFLARLGWGPVNDDKTVSMPSREMMLDMFLTKGRMRNIKANLDMNLLNSFDRKWKGRKEAAARLQKI